MGSKEAYKQKIEAEVELAQAKLAELRAKAKSSVADVRIKYAKQIDDLELGVGTTKVKLKELGEAKDDVWENLKAEVESAWGALRDGVRDIAAKLNK
ncbi:MAG: hypothetical protein NT087_10735 [Deltaproteobacteria bacterium]|nr:hypothetical protein [Deltaproteobacteria bacterium]